MIYMWFDGACWPRNPGGHMGWGSFITRRKKGKCLQVEILYEECGYFPPGETSNNLAEYWGLYYGLSFLSLNGYTNKKIIIFGDSKLVIKQMKGSWKVREGRYVQVAQKCQNLLGQFSQIKFKWIPRALNVRADYLSKKALKERGKYARVSNA